MDRINVAELESRGECLHVGDSCLGSPVGCKCLPFTADFLADFQKAITIGPQFHSESGAQIGRNH